MKITYSAPGKVILTGEHAVVYGKPALISAINLRLTFSVWEEQKHHSEVWIATLESAVKKYLDKKNIAYTIKSFNYSIESTIPQGSHMGSSAALSVASAGALLQLYTGKEWGKDAINTVAYEVEKYFHKNPSGCDNSTSCYGGLIFFRKEFEFLKQISALNFKIPKNIEDHLYLIDSGKPQENTGVMVEQVGKFYNSHPEKAEEIMNKIEKAVKRMVVAIVKEDRSLFKQSIEDNEKYLEELGIVSEKAKNLLNDLKQFGVGKVTGGGGIREGSGHLVFFADEPEILEKYLEEKNLSWIKFVQDKNGVQYEK